MLRVLEPGTVARLLEGTAGEARSLEFKIGFSWSNNETAVSFTQACVIKGVLGFTNTRYGGTIVIGIKDDGHGNIEYIGVTAEMIESFNDYEQVQQKLDSFADGPLNYEMGVGEFGGKQYIVVTVSEFTQRPVICAKDLKTDHGKQVLIKGDIYARSMRSKPSTIKATSLELSEIIKMAHEKDRDAVMELIRAVQQTAPLAQPNSPSPYTEMDQDL